LRGFDQRLLLLSAIGLLTRTATKLDLRPPVDDDCMDGNEVIDRLSQKPELPSPEQRWTVRRKATVIEAVRRGWISIDELTRR
jgi:hypothetical protein